jgi:hypothetical protein
LSKSKYQLRCIAPDGEHVVERRNFPTVEDAWRRADDMGSRWIFYPVCVVTGLAKVVAIPQGMTEYWVGRNFSTLCKAIAENPEDIVRWVHGEIPCPV